jgi:hypothetical protein
MKSTIKVATVLMVMMAVFGGVAQAQTPVNSDMVRFQGTLPGFGKGGSNKAGLYCVDFKLYDTPLMNAGTLVYAWPTCTVPYINVDGSGNYTVYLQWPADNNNGQANKQRAMAVLFGSPVPTEIQRSVVTSIAYASNANRVGGLTVAQIQAGAAGQPVYTNTGAAIASPHTVTGTVTLSSGNPGAASVTLSGPAAFSSSTSYQCFTTSMGQNAAVYYVTKNSGTSITFTGAGNGADVVAYMCVGN